MNSEAHRYFVFDSASRNVDEALLTDTIIESANHIIAVIDAEGRMVHLNRYGLEFTGYTMEEVTSEPYWWACLLPEAVRPEVRSIVEKAKKGNIIQRYENRWISKAGEEREFDWSNALVMDKEGSMKYLITMGIDISETKRNQDARMRSEENYRELFEGVRVAKLVIDLQTSAILNANDSAASFYGYSVEQLCSMKISQINVLSETQIRREMEAARNEKRDHFYFRHRLSNGEIRDVEVHTGPVVYNGKEALYSIIHDVTAEKAALRALEQERSRLNVLIESIPDLIWFKDPLGVYQYCNSRFAAMFRISREAIVGKNDFDLFSGERAQRYRYQDQAVISGKSPHISEEKVRFEDAHEEWIEKIKTVVRDENKEAIGVLGIGRDVTQRKAHEEEMQLLANIFSTTHDGIIICNAEEEIIDVNPAFTEIVGYSREEVLGKTPRMLSSGRQDSGFYSKMWKSIYEKGYWKGEVWNRNKEGEFYAVQTNISVLRDANGTITHFIGLFSDITSLKTHEEALEYMAHYDPLTSLPNRTLLSDRLEMAISHSKRNRGLLAVCFIDLDGFKPINDIFGHKAGDQVLIEIAQRLKEEVRADDTIARLGGDEFVVLLNDLKDTQDLERIVGRFLERVKRPFLIARQNIHVSASIGIAISRAGEMGADILLRRADQAMYKAKQMGRDQYHLFDEALDEVLKEHHAHIKEMRRALEEGEFELYYQPKVNMVSGEVFAAEGLIRWNHPRKGLLFPGAFLPFVKGHELERQIDYWVIREAIAQSIRWSEAGEKLIISVNVGGETFLHPDFLPTLKGIVHKYPDFDPSRLTFEVLETSMLEDIGEANSVFNECLEMGFGLSLDDFGTGYSSLSYLRHLPVQNIKIDQSFIKEIITKEEDLRLVESIINLTKIFNKNVIAEGVESEAIGSKLIEMGCVFAQGYAIARPMKSENLPHWLREWKPFSLWQKGA